MQNLHAVGYEIALSGTSFDGAYADHEFHAASIAGNDTFALIFTLFCLGQIYTQFTPAFYNATNNAGTSY